MSATVPLYIAALKLLLFPTRAYIIYIIYRKIITATFRIKMIAVNIS